MHNQVYSFPELETNNLGHINGGRDVLIPKPKNIENSLIKIDYNKNEAEIFSSNKLDFLDESKIKPFLTKEWVNKEDKNRYFILPKHLQMIFYLSIFQKIQN